MSMKEMACSYSCYLALFCRSLPSFFHSSFHFFFLGFGYLLWRWCFSSHGILSGCPFCPCSRMGECGVVEVPVLEELLFVTLHFH